jgi:hypothetical protein
MKKIVRLTESDLVRLVKKVIKEQEFDMDMGIDCDRILDEMEYVYMDTMRYYKRSSSDTKSILGTSDVYNDLMEELSGLLDMADQNDCENFIANLESILQPRICVNRIVDVLILDGLLIEMLCERYFLFLNSNNFNTNTKKMLLKRIMTMMNISKMLFSTHL